MRDPELWARLQAHVFDGPGSAPYSVKLARAQGWDADLTAAVIEEYRRFLYLTQVSAQQVTPSRMVDAAWHMHLTFTRDYWEDLCPNVIGQAIHHQPCAGDEEMPRYHDQFAATKALYEAEFGAEPPVKIWGGAERPRRHRRAPRTQQPKITGTTLIFVAVAGMIGVYVTEPDLHWTIYAVIFAAALGLGYVLDRATTPRVRRRLEQERELEFDLDPGVGIGRVRGRRDSDADTFGGDDGGGCGGCGD